MQYNSFANCIARCQTVKKFKIPSVPPTTNKSIRFPNDVIQQVEYAIQGKDCTFSAFVVEAVRVALENLQEEESEAAPVLPDGSVPASISENLFYIKE